MRVARVKAQAKVNLTLRVFPGIDAHGYHRLSTVFQRVDLHDVVVVRAGGGSRSLEVKGPRVPVEGLGDAEKNLAYRAAVAFIEHPQTAMSRGFSIELTKHIPVGGGLGGGSADAAAVLRALNVLCPRPLDSEQLRELAGSLGADVPFLASEDVAALGTERGDSLQPLGWTPPASAVALIVPDFGVSTKDAYEWLDHDRPTDPRADRSLVGASFPGWETLRSVGNDFEPVVEKRYPALREFRERLESSGAQLARLAGSGSSVFGIFDAASWAMLDHEFLELEIARFGGDVIQTRTSARVVEVEVLQ